MEKKDKLTLILGATVVVLLGVVGFMFLNPEGGNGIVPPPPPPVGSDAGHKWGFLTRDDITVAAEMQKLGANFVRTGTVELSLPFDELDKYYAELERRGLEIAVTPQPGFNDDIDDIIEYFRPFVQRYDGDGDYDNDGTIDGPAKTFVQYWQLGSEIDASAVGLEKVTPQRYVAVLKEFYKMVKEESPRAKVVGPSVIGHMNFPNNVGRDSKDYILQVIEAGGLQYADMIDFHYYYWWDALNYTDISHSMDFLRKNAPGKEIMLGETGAPSGTVEYEFDGEVTTRFYPEEDQAAYMAKIFPYAFSLGIERVVWAYGLTESRWGASTGSGFLLQGDGERPHSENELSNFKPDLDLGKTTLHWDNPAGDIAAVMIRYGNKEFPETTKEGTFIAEVNVTPGSSSAYLFEGTKSAKDYYYSIFPKYSDGTYGEPSKNKANYVDHYFAHTGLLYNGYGADDKGAGVKKRSYYTYDLLSEKYEQCDLSTAKRLSTPQNTTVAIEIEKKNGGKIYIAWSDAVPLIPPVVGSGGAKGGMTPGLVAPRPILELFIGAETARITNAVPDSAGNISSHTAFAQNGVLSIELGFTPIYIEPLS